MRQFNDLALTGASRSFRIRANTLALRVGLAFPPIMPLFATFEMSAQPAGEYFTVITETLPHLYNQVMTPLIRES